MKIVVNHLTRMQKGFMCVAGIDLQTGRHIRPLLRQQMRTSMLAAHGGPFDIGCVVDLVKTRYIGERPETEDHLFSSTGVSRLPDMNPHEFWRQLSRVAKPKLKEIFGEDLQPVGRSCAVEQRKGMASLGCLRTQRPVLCVRNSAGQPRIRMILHSGSYEFNVPVTDIRLFRADHVTPNPHIVMRTADRLGSAEEVVLSVGLGRRFKRTSTEPARHWLQVNNIHFADDPCWQLCGEFSLNSTSTESGPILDELPSHVGP